MATHQEARLKEAVRQPSKEQGSRETDSLNQPKALSAIAGEKSRANRPHTRHMSMESVLNVPEQAA